MVIRPNRIDSFDGMAKTKTNPAGPTLELDGFVSGAMLALHSVLRREFELLPVAVGRVTSGAQGRALVVAEHAEVLLTVLDLHCRAEAQTVWPLLVDRCFDAFELPRHLMRRQHEEIKTLVDQFKIVLHRWRCRVTAGSRDELICAIAGVTTAMHEHLTTAEELVVPLMNEHITAGEFEAIMELQALDIEPSVQFLLLGMLMYEGDSRVVERTSATIFSAGKQRAAADYFHHCVRVHGTGRPPLSTQLFGYLPDQDASRPGESAHGDGRRA
jgi:hemerythrin-like domain-containing protein